MKPKVTYLSRAGLEREQCNLAGLKTKLASIRTEKSDAYTATGDQWHDNPNWNRLEQDEARTIEEMAALDKMIGTSRIFEAPEVRPVERVSLGSIVHIEKTDEKTGAAEEAIWEIVPYGDTDLNSCKIGYNAPLASLLMGHEPGDEVILRTQGAAATISITDLYPSMEAAQAKAPELFSQASRPSPKAPRASKPPVNE